MSKIIFQILLIFVVGTVGGIFADQILWPYFVERPLLLEYRIDQPPIYLNETKEIIIQENTALENTIEKVEKTVISIKTKKKSGKTLEGSGLIVTSDGLAVTLAELLPKDATFTFYIKEDSLQPFKEIKGQVLKRDLKNNLAEIKLEATNLPSIAFADLEKIKLGKRVFLLGTEGLPPIFFTNQGLISTFSQDLIETNIFETKNVTASSLFDIEGNVLGLNTADDNGRVTTIPITKIRDFLGF